MATRRASGYYADPALGAVGESIGAALFGDPEQAGQMQLRAAQAAFAGERARGQRIENEGRVTMAAGIRRGIIPNGTVRAPDDRGGYTQNDLHADAVLAGMAREVPALNRSLVYSAPAGTFSEGQMTNASLGAGEPMANTREGFNIDQTRRSSDTRYTADSSAAATLGSARIRAGADIEQEGMRQAGQDRRMHVPLPANGDVLLPPNSPLVRGLPREYQGGAAGVQNGQPAPPLVPRPNEATELPAPGRNGQRPRLTPEQAAGIDPTDTGQGPIRVRGRDRPENMSQAQAQLLKELADPNGITPEREAQILRLLPAGTIAGQEARLAVADKRAAEDRASREGIARNAQDGANQRAAAAQAGATQRNEATIAGAAARTQTQTQTQRDIAAQRAGAPQRPTLVPPNALQGFRTELDLELSNRQLNLEPDAKSWVLRRAEELFSSPDSPLRNRSGGAIQAAVTELLNAAGDGDRTDTRWLPTSRSYRLPQSLVPAPGQPPASAQPAPPLVPAQRDAPAADPLEGRTATNSAGQRIIRRNGQWEPIQ